MGRWLPRLASTRRAADRRPPRHRTAVLIALVLAGLAPAAPTTAAPHTPDDPTPRPPTIDAPGPVIEREPIRLGSSAGGGSGPAGAPGLAVTTGTGASTGTEWALDGTFSGGDVYKTRVWVKVPSGTTISLRLGVSADAPSAVTHAGTGTWTALDLTWTPAADRTSVRLALYRAGSGSAVTFHVDDALVWDSASGKTDWSIPTETAYDRDGRIVASVLPPGVPGTAERPLVTRTAYDALGRVTQVTVNEIGGAGTGSADVNLTTATAYDALGRVSTVTDPTGTVTKYAYDRLGRLTAATDNYLDGTPATQYGVDDVTSTFAYSAASELIGYCPAAQVWTTTCDPADPAEAQAWHYAFDDAGRMARQTPPVNVTATALATKLWTYDPGGRLVIACDGPSSITTCASSGVLRTSVPTYDAVGRTTRLDTFAGPSTTLAIRTDTTYYGDGAPKQLTYSTGTTPTVVDVLDLEYDTLGRPTKVKDGATVLTDATYRPDGALATRIDGDAGAIGTSAFTYDWAGRLASVDLPNSFSTAIPNFGWRLDGLLASRTFDAGSTATFAYDSAKRLTGITKGGLSFDQTYDRDGNVTAESRSLPGVSGDPGSGSQSFSYDALGRLTGSSGLAAPAETYTYDRDGNRRTAQAGATTSTYVHDRTGELVSITKGILPLQSFAYDAYGNLTGNAETGTAVTALTYDLADRLTGIDPVGTTNDTTFALDALGRIAGRTINGTTDAFDFVGASETVTAITTGATTLQSIVGPTGDRLGISDGTTRNWFVPDPHGSIGGALSENEATVTSAIRYDGWGETIGSGTGGGTPVGTGHFRYQGRLDLSPSGLATPLYEFSARNYSPGIASFTGLDAVMGSATDPLSMHRFLYAEANPTSLIDPTGHGTECQMGVTCSAELRMVEQRSRQRYERRVTERRRTDFVRRQSRARPVDSFRVPTIESTGAAPPSEPGRIAAILWRFGNEYRANRLPQFEGDVPDDTLDEMVLVLDQIYYYDLIGDVGKATELRSAMSTSLPTAYPALVSFRRGDARAIILLTGMVGIGKEGIGGRPTPAAVGRRAGPSTWGDSETLDDHFKRHGPDFGSRSAEEYANQASDFLVDSQRRRLPTKVDRHGTIRVYDRKTNTFGSYNPDGSTRTYFKPDPAKHGKPTNDDYWASQQGADPWSP